MNFHPYVTARALEGSTQIIAQGPVAALEFIKNLGTNGGGFFNVNGAHPYENPTALTKPARVALHRHFAGSPYQYLRKNGGAPAPGMDADILQLRCRISFLCSGGITCE
jgi:hypothetical protein